MMMNSLIQSDLVSIIVRTHDPGKLCFLEVALASIHNQSYRPIEVVIVVQTKSDSFVKATRDLLSRYQDPPSFLGQVIVNRTTQDERAKNVNLGIAASQGRYIGFLDDDDVFSEDHIASLLHPLQKDDFAWSYGDVALVQCRLSESKEIQTKGFELPYKHSQFSLVNLFDANFIPINAYLLDRHKIKPELLRFDESFTVGEDYAFLLRLAAQHTPAYVEAVVSEYRVFDDLSNSNVIMNDKLGQPDKAKIKAWSYALWKTEALKASLMPGYSTGIFSLRTRKYLFYKFPGLKVLLQYKFPVIRQMLVASVKKLNLMK